MRTTCRTWGGDALVHEEGRACSAFRRLYATLIRRILVFRVQLAVVTQFGGLVFGEENEATRSELDLLGAALS
jgi:hypothetical protein